MDIMFRREVLGLSGNGGKLYGKKEYVVSVPLHRLRKIQEHKEYIEARRLLGYNDETKEDYHYFTQTQDRKTVTSLVKANTDFLTESSLLFGGRRVILHENETEALIHAYGAHEGYYSEDRKDILKRDKNGWRGSAFGGARTYYFLQKLAGRSGVNYHTMEKIRFGVLNFQGANNYTNTKPNYAHGVATLDNMQVLSDIEATMITHNNKSDATTETLVSISHVNPNIQGYKTRNCIVLHKGFWNAFSNLYYEDYKTLETSQAEHSSKLAETNRILGWVAQIDSEITRATLELERLSKLEKLCTKKHITQHLLKVFYYNDLMKEEIQANTDLYRPAIEYPRTPMNHVYDSVVNYSEYTATPEWAAVLRNGSFNDLSYLWQIEEREDYLTTTPTLNGIDEAEEFYDTLDEKDLDNHFYGCKQVFPDISDVNEKQGAFDLLTLENKQLGEKITLTYKLLSQQLFMHLQDFMCGKEMEEE